MKPIANVFRLVLASLVVYLSSASAVHDVLHHAHSAAATREVSPPASKHAGHSDDCEFCAKGPTTSVEATTVWLVHFSRPEIIAGAESPVTMLQPALPLATLRGPPCA